MKTSVSSLRAWPVWSCCLALLALPLHADQNLAGNVTVTGGASTGNLSVTGAIDSDGNVLTFGTQGSTFGGALLYQDSTTDTLTFSINRTPASWLWQHNAGISAMRLGSLHDLILYQDDGTTAGLTLQPASNSLKLGSTATLTGDTSGVLTTSGAFTVTGNFTNTNGTLTGGATGLTLTAGGTNQNVTLTPSGTGYTILNGNVGIGTASPGAKLHVYGASTGTNVPTTIFDKSYSTAGDTSTAIRVNLNAGLGGGYMMGYSGDFAISHNVEYISGTGYVARQATASQVGQQGGNIYFNSNSGLTAGSAFTPTARMYIQGSTGNVGIGTTTPVQPLEVYKAGNAIIAVHQPNAPAPGKYAQITLTHGPTYFGASDKSWQVVSNGLATGEADLVFQYWNGTGYAPYAAITNNGNVGIGTISPSERLTVTNNSINAITLGVRGTYPPVSTTGTNYFKQVEIGEPRYNIPAGVVDSGYRIGLAVQGYTHTSDFAGTLDTQMSLWVRAGSNSNVPTGTITNSYGIYLENLDGGANVINKYGLYQSNSTAKNYFAGSVGIGTTNPASPLQVVGNFGISPSGISPEIYPGSIHISQSLASGQSLSMSKPGYYPWSIGWVYNTTTFGIGTSQSTDSNFTNPQFVINTSGNVGIGTTSPSHKLAVNGTIRAKEVIVDTGWADYVFADDYRLAPLAEVESHIKAKKHLPGIPSAAEVAEHGVSMGDMQAKLLSKVEELTLHLIQQEKELTSLRREVAQLKSASLK